VEWHDVIPAKAGTQPKNARCLLGWASAFAGVTLIACTTVTIPGDPARGREVFVSRDAGHCVICHSIAGISPAGNVGPPLDGVGSRLNAGELRQRVSDITKLKPEATMPAFHRTEGLNRVALAYRGKPVLSEQQVEDVVAWLSTLR
jgi:sulfur-oxidizing protein SoxX